MNPGGTSCCQACGGPFRTGGQQQPPADGEYAERPTLAQMRGLAPPPPKKLTERQWVDVEFNAMVRGDANGTCSICFNDFSSGDQVILDCSHTVRALPGGDPGGKKEQSHFTAPLPLRAWGGPWGEDQRSL